MSDKKADTLKTTQYSNFTLIDLLSIILLVGLIFVFVVPVHQAKISRDRVNEALTTLRMIGEKTVEFKNDPANGDYPVDISQLNLGDKIKSNYFEYSVVPEDSTIVAETTQAFGKKGAFLVYSLSGKQFRIGKNDSDVESQKFINENWLP